MERVAVRSLDACDALGAAPAELVRVVRCEEARGVTALDEQFLDPALVLVATTSDANESMRSP